MTLSAVLLAGGESRRMGQDKATIEFRGESLWQRQLATLRDVAPETIFVSARSDPAWRPNDCLFVADSSESHGPWSGLAAAIAQMRSSHLLVLAIDMPLMTAAYLRSLGEFTRDGCGVVPQRGESYEPLAAIYPREADVDLAQPSPDRDYSLQSLIGRLINAGKVRARSISESERALFRNVNAPRDLDANE